MSQKTVSLSDAALDYYDFFRLAEAALEPTGAAFVSGLVPEERIYALANLCLTFHRPLRVADMVGQPVGQMLPPRGQIHARGYFADYSQIEPPLNIPDQITLLCLHDDNADNLYTAFQALIPRLGENSAVFISGQGINEQSRSRFDALLEGAKMSRQGDFWIWKEAELGENAATTMGPEDAFTILCYPHFPGGKFRKMCEKAGYRVTISPTDPFDFAIRWIGETYMPKDPVTRELAAQVHLVNVHCEDISKDWVEQMHREVFGYSLEVDPTQYTGRVVQKANLNAQLRESVIECPIQEPAHGFVYQRLVTTPTEPDEYEEYRVAITEKEITYVVVKRRPLSHRFDRSAGYAIVKNADEVFSPEEQALIFKMCEKANFEYGDLDILREQSDGLIFIIDLNPTPGGPGGGYTQEQRDDIVSRLTKAFNNGFFKNLITQ